MNKEKSFKESIKYLELDSRGRIVRIVGACKAKEFKK